MTPEALAILLSDPTHRRVFSAVSLGASKPSEILDASGLAAPQAAEAIGQLFEAGLLVAEGPGRLAVDEEVLAEAADLARRREEEEEAAAQPDPRLRGYIRGGLLVQLPEQDDESRRAVLRHVADTTFGPGDEYDERTVTDRLRPWCEGSPVDVVSLRRSLVDAGSLDRKSGRYRLVPQVGPAPSS
ncbi:DUF2087 domain-containing protein [Micromonospora sp. NBC_01699]|uniref:DUF2087 domain-containing protein n=1 Tax=Micromonospora sp. NBC_01699 TaxID=2975984 RepID=UPI002E2FF28C|nr:DUF2087 domain-containing protein [Micromonospora sp. NBC_01699]